MWLWLTDRPVSVLPAGQCRSISDKLPTQPFPPDRHRPAARGAPLPIPDQGGQTHLSYSGWSVCHVRKWVLSLDWTGICLSGVLSQKSADGAFCGWDQDVLVLVLLSILTAFDCILPHPRSQFLCRDVSFKSEVVWLLSLLSEFRAITGECALNVWICLSDWDGRTRVVQLHST